VPAISVCKKASQSFLRKQKIKFKIFLAAACTWTKIHLRLQVSEEDRQLRLKEVFPGREWRKTDRGTLRENGIRI
jgi:hypothetical protein